MHTKVATPYGVKTLLECMARAALLAQPDDISTFLTLYMKNMFRSRTEDGKDIKVVAFDYEEDWEKNILKRDDRPTCKPAPVFPETPVPSLKYEEPFVAAVAFSPEEEAPLGPDMDVEELEKEPSVAAPSPEEAAPVGPDMDVEEFEKEPLVAAPSPEEAAPVGPDTDVEEFEKEPLVAAPSPEVAPVGPDTDVEEFGKEPSVESASVWLSAPPAEPPKQVEAAPWVPPIKVDRPKPIPREESRPVLFRERKPLAQPIRPELKPSSSRTPVAGRSTSSPVKESGLSSLWFPKEGDFFAQNTGEKPFSSKQKVPSPGKEKKEHVRTRRLPSHKLPNQENIGTQTGDLKREESPRFRGDRVLSLRGQPEPKPGGRSTRSLYPPPLRKSTSEIPKQVKKKPIKKPEKDFVCHDPECPYHRKPGQQFAVTCPLQPTGASRESRGRVPDMWSGAARPKTKTPYRPRGGYLYDPELDTKKTRGSRKPVLHRPSSAESIFLIVRPPSLGSSDSAQAGGAAAAPAPQGVQAVPEVTPQFASFIKHRCLYLQDRSTRTLSPTMCTIKIPQGPVTNIQSVRNMQSHLTQCNQLHEIRWI